MLKSEVPQHDLGRTWVTHSVHRWLCLTLCYLRRLIKEPCIYILVNCRFYVCSCEWNQVKKCGHTHTSCIPVCSEEVWCGEVCSGKVWCGEVCCGLLSRSWDSSCCSLADRTFSSWEWSESWAECSQCRENIWDLRDSTFSCGRRVIYSIRWAMMYMCIHVHV